MDWKQIDRETTEAELAQAADLAERDALLALLQKHLTIRVFKDYSGQQTNVLKIEVDFAGQPVASDWTHI